MNGYWNVVDAALSKFHMRIVLHHKSTQNHTHIQMNVREIYNYSYTYKVRLLLDKIHRI